MVNKVILEGVLQRTPYLTQTNKGTKKALFTLEITTYEEGATTKYIEIETYGSNVDKIERLVGGETIYVEAKLYSYKSTKYDCYITAVNANEVTVKTNVATNFKSQQSTQQEPVQQVVEPSLPESYYQISDDDLPF